MQVTDVAPARSEAKKFWVRDYLLPLRDSLSQELLQRKPVWKLKPKPFEQAPSHARLVGVMVIPEMETMYIELADHGPHIRSTNTGKPYRKFVVHPKLVTYEAPAEMCQRLAFFVDNPICQQAPVYVYSDGRIVIYGSYEKCGEAREANDWQILYWTDEMFYEFRRIKVR
jgi:hypothetical protein